MKNIIIKSTIIVSNEDVIFQRIDNYIVMADMISGYYFSLSGSAKLIWDMLSQPVAVHSICAALEEEFEVSQEVCERDVVDFLGEMNDAGLIRVIG